MEDTNPPVPLADPAEPAAPPAVAPAVGAKAGAKAGALFAVNERTVSRTLSLRGCTSCTAPRSAPGRPCCACDAVPRGAP